MKNLLYISLPVLAFASQAVSHNFEVADIDSIVSQMTLEQKALLLNGSISSTELGLTFVGNNSEYIPGAAAPTMTFPEYNIPFTVLADGPAGLRINPFRDNDSASYYCTAFPTGSALAASWDIEMVERVTAAMGSEVLEYGCDVLLAPGVNIQRNPLCGRNFEYMSEDPVLAGEIGAAYVRGLQSKGVGASVKHYFANNQETNRLNSDSRISTRAIREIYLKPFEIIVKKSDPWTIMSSYNKVNGTYVAESYPFLQTILRDEWGWQGMVMTDWIEPRNTAAQIHAGNDLLCPGSETQVKDIIEGVKSGKISIEDVDRNAKRILMYVARTPHWNNYHYSNTPDLNGNAAISREAAARCMVLLKNEGVLPLDTAAHRRVALYGNGSYDYTCGGTGSGNVNRAYSSQIFSGLDGHGFEINGKLKDTYLAYLDYAMKKLYNDKSIVLMNFGRMYPFEEMPLTRESMILREPESDVAIYTICRNSGEGRDRQLDGDYMLTAAEQQSIKDLAAIYHKAGKKLIVVLNVGGPVETASWRDYADAILCAWQSGQEGGNAVADILSGKVNPGGRLPMTFAIDYYDYASSANFPHDDLAVPQRHTGFWEPQYQRNWGKDYDYTDYAEGIYVGYRHFDKNRVATAYPFGYGLSYTTFEYGNPVMKRKNGVTEISLDVTNTGNFTGREVVQLYVKAPDGILEKPDRELKGFRVTGDLQPGQSERVILRVEDKDLASFDEKLNAWVVDSGTYRFMIGGDAETGLKEVKVKVSKQVTPVIAEF